MMPHNELLPISITTRRFRSAASRRCVVETHKSWPAIPTQIWPTTLPPDYTPDGNKRQRCRLLQQQVRSGPIGRQVVLLIQYLLQAAAPSGK